MANKNARILWSVMTREQGYDPHHVSVKPLAKHQPAPPGPRPVQLRCATGLHGLSSAPTHRATQHPYPSTVDVLSKMH